MDKREATLDMARDMLASIEEGNPVTDTARASLPMFARMVERYDADLADSLRSHSAS